MNFCGEKNISMAELIGDAATLASSPLAPGLGQ